MDEYDCIWDYNIFVYLYAYSGLEAKLLEWKTWEQQEEEETCRYVQNKLLITDIVLACYPLY